jgi:hypothetical protein
MQRFSSSQFERTVQACVRLTNQSLEITTRTRRRYEGPLSVDPRIARLLRVRLRLPRALVEDILCAQCYTEVDRDANGWRREIPYVRGKKHGTVRWWRADGSLRCEIPYVDGKARGTATWWRADGTRKCEIPYVNNKAHGTATWWRADGTVEWVEEWKNGEQCE